jgi:endogenous inhibitor of DNA gyrase (YacG/DUF329 family)
MIRYICPTCHTPVVIAQPEELPTRPFCRAQCKWIDLDKWFNEEYWISEPLRADDELRDQDVPRRAPAWASAASELPFPFPLI